MKKRMFTLSLVLLLCTACHLPQPETLQAGGLTVASEPPVLQMSTTGGAAGAGPESWETIRNSYYTGQADPAFAFLQKNRMQRFLTEHWTPAAIPGITNPTWHFESFAKYVVMDSAGVVEADDLYYCTFSAEDKKYGFIVVRYSEIGPSMQNQGIVQTDCRYDLRAMEEAVFDALDQTDLDLSTTVAVRGRLGSDEVILFEDNDGNRYACDLMTFKFTKI